MNKKQTNPIQQQNKNTSSSQGEMLQIAEARLREISKKILTSQEEERRRISRDLHDETGQLSVSLGSYLSLIEKELNHRRINSALKLIKDTKNVLGDITNKMKILSVALRPPELDILELPEVLRDYFAYYTKTYPLKLKFKENLEDLKIQNDVAITLYRAIQEALNNIVKHSKAKHVNIDLIVEGNKLKLTIADDGKGFSIDEVMKDTNTNNIGIRGMKERVDLLNGKFYIQSKHNKGTKIIITFPVEDKQMTHRGVFSPDGSS